LDDAAKALDMTAPVITGPQTLAMTAPVLTAPNYMQFVLPFELKHLEDVPRPKSSDITIKAVPRKIMAVSRFSGSYSDSFFHTKLQQLYNKLKQESIVAEQEVRGDEYIGGLPWSFAQYNPPFTFPLFRRNEVWIELNENTFPKVQELIAVYEKQQEKTPAANK
jgi:hypothetical protein